jgi:hypothetical protein
MRKTVIAILLVALAVPALAVAADKPSQADRDARFAARVAKYNERDARIDAHQAKFTERCLGEKVGERCAAAGAKIVSNLSRRIDARNANLAKLDARCAARPADKPCGDRAAQVKKMIQDRIAKLQGFRSAVLAKYPSAS